MAEPFFDHPILNSPYEYPVKHWELDEAGQPTQKVIDQRRRAKFITPIPIDLRHASATCNTLRHVARSQDNSQ
jgi:type III restriction enzyme